MASEIDRSSINRINDCSISLWSYDFFNYTWSIRNIYKPLSDRYDRFHQNLSKIWILSEHLI
nr:MAG TPA: hypothetical protein [Caudoviricetes sp.]